jgi:hypothetical protein
MTPEEARKLVVPLQPGAVVRRGVMMPSNPDGSWSVSYSVWEPIHGGILNSDHSTITAIDSKWYGELHSRRLPLVLECLEAYSDERATCVRAWHDELSAMAHSVILHAFPHLVQTADYVWDHEISESVRMTRHEAYRTTGEYRAV